METSEKQGGVIEFGRGSLVTPDVPDGGADRFNPLEFVKVGKDFEDIWMRSSLDGEDSVIARMVIQHFLLHVCGLVVPLHDIRIWLLASSAIKGKARDQMMQVATAMFAAQMGGGAKAQSGEDAKGLVSQLLSIGRRG